MVQLRQRHRGRHFSDPLVGGPIRSTRQGIRKMSNRDGAGVMPSWCKGFAQWFMLWFMLVPGVGPARGGRDALCQNPAGSRGMNHATCPGLHM